MTSKDPLIRHAISPPAFDSRNGIHRERLVDAIHANIARKLIAIGAPAGFGKTTLLADFSAHTDLTVCWVRLSEADWDVMRFASVLAASLHSRFRRLRGQPDLEALATSSPEALAIAFANAIDEQISEAFVIALDDVHLINQSKPVLALLDRLLLELPEHVTVVAAGREVLETSVLAQLMAEGDLAGFGPHDLALTREELVDLSERLQGQELPAAEIDRLLEESRGWVTGIVMSGRVADLNSGTLFGGGRPMVYEYLASVVLNRQPDDLRRFALDASVLPVMMSSSCDRVLGRDDSRKYLGQLERKGLFVTASQITPKTYEFHPLFRDFLLESLESANPRRLARLRRAAADYFIKQDAPELAVDLLIDAGSISRAAKLAETSSKWLYDQGRIHTLERWVERFRPHGSAVPNMLLRLVSGALDRGELSAAEELVGRAGEFVGQKSSKELQARLQIAQGFVRYRQDRPTEAIEAVRRVEKIYAKRADARLLGISRRLEALSLLQTGADFERVEALLGQAAEQLEEAGDTYNQLATLVDLSTIQCSMGQNSAGRHSRRRALALAREIGAPLPLSVALGNSALSAHEAGDFRMALNFAGEGLRFARQAASPLREGINLIRQADVFSDVGLLRQAAELYEQALARFMDLDAVKWIQYCCVHTSKMHRRAGGLEAAREWIKNALLLEDRQQSSAQLRIQLGAIETFASPDKALNVLAAVLDEGSGRALEVDEITLSRYFLGRAALAQGDEDRAVQHFQQALDVAGAYLTEQYIAAELLWDDEATEFIDGGFEAGAVLPVVLDRVETMRAFARHYELPKPDSAAAREVRIKALGASAVLVNGQEQSGLKPRSREVLFYLLDRGRATTDHLAEAFWPDLPAGRKKASLHTAVSEIRSELGKDSIQLSGATYYLDPESPLEYDVRRFEQASAVVDGLPPGDPRLMFALTEAKNTYTGRFLPEYDSEWVGERRSELELRFLDVLASFAYQAIVNNQPGQAVSALREALGIDPYRDDINYSYMDALGRLGRRAELVAHYRSYVQLLSEDLGLDPPERTRDLYDRLIG